MRVYHVSDMHGEHRLLDKAGKVPPDAWIITGDFFPDSPYGYVVRCEETRKFQLQWWNRTSGTIKSKLLGAPVICVDGNHDAISLSGRLQSANIEVYQARPSAFILRGISFAGYPNVPIINGTFNHESGAPEMRALAEQTITVDGPDVLVTHCPPNGILDRGYGCHELATRLKSGRHRVKHHFFGHIHECGGKTVELYGIEFHNSARNFQVFDI